MARLRSVYRKRSTSFSHNYWLIYFLAVSTLVVLMAWSMTRTEEVITIWQRVNLSSQVLKGVLHSGMPLMAVSKQDLDGPAPSILGGVLPEFVTAEASTQSLLNYQWPLMETLAHARDNLASTAAPAAGLKQPAPQTLGPASGSTAVPPLRSLPVDNNGTLTTKLDKRPLVAIYNTHNAETYILTDQTDRIEGSNAGVVRVATVLAGTLDRDFGKPVIQSTKIHDYPDWNASYGKSATTLQQLLRNNPSIQVVIDVHRDAGLEERSVAVFPEGSAAKILLIVGSNKRLDHPQWKQNLAFAEKVEAKMNALYPGLSRGVRVQDGRYNQNMHPRSILVEMGSSLNTLQEAETASRLFARVISQVLEDLAKVNRL